VLCIPARDEADELATRMLVQLLNKHGIDAEAVPVSMIAGGLEAAPSQKTKIACVSSVPPFGYTNARYLCRRLRSRFADLKVVAAILTESSTEELKQRQPPIVADELASSLTQEVSKVLALISHFPQQPAQLAAA
jgi:hypothetical protein